MKQSAKSNGAKRTKTKTSSDEDAVVVQERRRGGVRYAEHRVPEPASGKCKGFFALQSGLSMLGVYPLWNVNRGSVKSSSLELAVHSSRHPISLKNGVSSVQR